ncbi:hypothetical protein HQO83_06055 [Rhodococcus fascians]|nr:hypothetical protein [Rhodococcus fascians]
MGTKLEVSVGWLKFDVSYTPPVIARARVAAASQREPTVENRGETMLKKSLTVAALSIACAVGFAPLAQAADDVPDFDDDIKGNSISAVRAAVKATGNLLLVKLEDPINGCDDEDRVATAIRAVYFPPIDRYNVTVTFSC